MACVGCDTGAEIYMKRGVAARHSQMSDGRNALSPKLKDR